MKPIVTSQKELNSPITIKDILLLSPGVWNDTEYPAQEIIKAFNNTDWSDKKNTNLFLDHQDTKERGVGNWAGFVKNPRLANNSELWGDLEVWNPLIATFLKEAKAPFGISSTLSGTENLKEKLDGAKSRMEDFHYDSFSIVTDPACIPARMNLNKQGKAIKVVTLSQINPEDFNEENIIINKKEVKMTVKKLEEDKVEEEEKEEPKEEEEEKKEESVMENMMKKLDALVKDMSEVKKKLEEEPAEEKAEELPEVKVEESEKVEVSVEEEPVKVEEESKEEEKELEKVKKELGALKEELSKPDRKTLSAEVSLDEPEQDSNQGMLHFLQNRIR